MLAMLCWMEFVKARGSISPSCSVRQTLTSRDCGGAIMVSIIRIPVTIVY